MEIANKRDPNQIENLRSEKKQAEIEKLRAERALPALEDLLNLLEKHAYVNYYFVYQTRCIELEEQRKKKEGESKKRKRKGKKTSKKAHEIVSRIDSLQKEIRGIYRELTPRIEQFLPKKEKNRLGIWKELDIFDLEGFELNRLKIETQQLWSWFYSQKKELSGDESLKNASTVKQLIQALKRFETSKITIHEIKLTLKDLIHILEKQNKKNLALLSKSENVDTIFDQLKDLSDLIINLEGSLKEKSGLASSMEVTNDEYLDDIESQLASIISELEIAERKYDYYLEKCREKGISDNLLKQGSITKILQTLPSSKPVDPYLSSSEEAIEDKINELRDEIESKEKEIVRLKTIISVYQEDIKNLEKQKPHKYEEHFEELNILLRTSNLISQKLLQDYRENLRALRNNRIKKKDIEEKDEMKLYFEQVSKYLAHRIGSFRHIDKVYKAKSVDLISGLIVTKGGVRIRLADMGTGQSQSTYLLSLLSTKKDPRKIIALFDEIAMMDETSLKPLHHRLKELYEEKRLLLGILVQKARQLRVSELT